jgi:hypothetical protein
MRTFCETAVLVFGLVPMSYIGEVPCKPLCGFMSWFAIGFS